MLKWNTCAVITGLGWTMLTGCSSYNVVPAELEGKLNRNLNFEQVKQSPESYKGELVVWGGEIVKASRIDNGTRIDVMQLPLTEDLSPALERTRSRGTFIALDMSEEKLDPSSVEAGSARTNAREDLLLDPGVTEAATPVTIIGEIESPRIIEVDGKQHKYPTLRVRDMTVWDRTVYSRPYGMNGMAYPPVSTYPPTGYGLRPRVVDEGTRVP